MQIFGFLWYTKNVREARDWVTSVLLGNGFKPNSFFSLTLSRLWQNLIQKKLEPKQLI